MFVVFNIVMILLVALIAYWWANQGLFSALLHLVCVIVAGAIALAFWEPLVVGVLLKGNKFDAFAWGIALAGLFAVSLFVLRLAMDKLAPGNVRVPTWASMTFGGAAGLVAGILTIGMFIISIGFVQSSNDLMGFRGWAREGARITEVNRMWLPFHKWTDAFYATLSTGALSTSTPLKQYYPELDRQVTLVRDTFSRGRGQISMAPDAVTIRKVDLVNVTGVGAAAAQAGVENGTAIAVQVSFNRAARDWGQQLALSAAQVRLIGDARGRRTADVIHPVGFKQHSGVHLFDDTSHYVTTEPGQETGEVTLLFESPSETFMPRFIQIKGTRFTLPTPEQTALDLTAILDTVGAGLADAIVGGRDVSSTVRISNDIRPISASTNMLPGGLEHRDKYLTEGEGEFVRGGPRPSRTLMIKGIEEPSGVRIVKVNVSRGGLADIYEFPDLPMSAEVKLIDADGRTYTPMGYILITPDSNKIVLHPSQHLTTFGELPQLPTSGVQTLELVFTVTEGVTITGLRVGSFDVGSCSVLVPAKG